MWPGWLEEPPGPRNPYPYPGRGRTASPPPHSGEGADSGRVESDPRRGLLPPVSGKVKGAFVGITVARAWFGMRLVGEWWHRPPSLFSRDRHPLGAHMVYRVWKRDVWAAWVMASPGPGTYAPGWATLHPRLGRGRTQAA
ncbi:hypothetical protein GCM10018966_045600 [Streptomyces yanii]